MKLLVCRMATFRSGSPPLVSQKLQSFVVPSGKVTGLGPSRLSHWSAIVPLTACPARVHALCVHVPRAPEAGAKVALVVVLFDVPPPTTVSMFWLLTNVRTMTRFSFGPQPHVVWPLALALFEKVVVL